MENNQYQQVYRASIKKINSIIPMKQAEQMARQMNLIYNAFGLALKDLIKLLSYFYTQSSVNLSKTQTHHASNRISEVEEDRFSSYSRSGYSQQQKIQKIKSKQSKDIGHRNDKIQYPNFDKYVLGISEQVQGLKKNKVKQIQRDEKLKNQKDHLNVRKQKNVQRVQNVRGKKERETLNGYSCTMCQEFYRALGEDYTNAKGQNKLCNDCSRHRSNLPPTNFNTDFSQQFGFDD